MAQTLRAIHPVMPDWQQMLSDSIVSSHELKAHLPGIPRLNDVTATYPMRINPYLLSLIREPGDPIWRQFVPDAAELADDSFQADPLREDAQSPVPNLVHRYPDRVVLLVTDQCAAYCRFCMRKRRIAHHPATTSDTIERSLDYIRRESRIRDVVLSGGDPLMVDDLELEAILERLRQIPHVEIIRIHTRMPAILPQRITKDLTAMLARLQPLYLNIHVNHPSEITGMAQTAFRRLADAGIPLGSQTVLLRGVNDTPETIRELMRRLVACRIRPYYLHHPDAVKGTAHFRPPVSSGLEIVKSLHGHVSGLCVPHYKIDLPGGGGKVPLIPDYIRQYSDTGLIVENYDGKIFSYPTALDAS